ncbi:hypothetical protein FOZ63_028368, partial [Perkinsus olseni]
VDFLAKPWLVLGKLQTSPAGKQCFYLTEPSASPFEPRPAHLRRTNSGLPCSSRRSRSIKGQRSSGSSSTTSKSSNNSARLLGRSVSQPDIPSFQRIMNNWTSTSSTMTLQRLVAPIQSSVIVPAPYDPRVAKDEPFNVTLIATRQQLGHATASQSSQ